MNDRNGNSLNPGDRVRFQVHPNRPWVAGTVTEDGRVRSDYNGSLSVLWVGCTERCSGSSVTDRVRRQRPREFTNWPR